MKNRLSAVAFDDMADLRRSFTDLLRDGLEFGKETLSGFWQGNERRRAPRVPCHLACRMDLGFPETPACEVKVLNISTSGCLLSVPAVCEIAEHMHEIGEISLDLDDGDTLNLYGTIVRVAPDPDRRDAAGLLAGFCFTAVDESTRNRISRYVDCCECGMAGEPVT